MRRRTDATSGSTPCFLRTQEPRIEADFGFPRTVAFDLTYQVGTWFRAFPMEIPKKRCGDSELVLVTNGV